jgi:hypothetical protein
MNTEIGNYFNIKGDAKTKLVNASMNRFRVTKHDFKMRLEMAFNVTEPLKEKWLADDDDDSIVAAAIDDSMKDDDDQDGIKETKEEINESASKVGKTAFKIMFAPHKTDYVLP